MAYSFSSVIMKKTRIKINKVKTTFTGRSPRHTQVGHPDDTKKKTWSGQGRWKEGDM
jgi:DNA-binding protein H-NS